MAQLMYDMGVEEEEVITTGTPVEPVPAAPRSTACRTPNEQISTPDIDYVGVGQSM